PSSTRLRRWKQRRQTHDEALRIVGFEVIPTAVGSCATNALADPTIRSAEPDLIVGLLDQRSTIRHMPPPDERAAFRQRLGTYLLGVAIGLVILGFYWQARRAAVRQQALQQQAAPSPAAGNSGGPPATPAR